jgi:hypothetical protein
MYKNFTITESEKKEILNQHKSYFLLNEKLGEKLTPRASQSPKAQWTKKTASFLNSYYNINLNAATTGNWQDKDYNEYLKKFMEEKGISVWICKKNDGYCRWDGADEGEVTTKEWDKLKQAMTPQSNQQEKINTTNDKKYDYKFSNGKYYYSLKGQNKWVEAKGNTLNAIKTKVKF